MTQTAALPLTRLYTLQALTPLHAGTGQGVGDIDLPVARERATNLPFVPGASVRGVLRDSLAGMPQQLAIFGPESKNAHEFAGAVSITDAQLLLFPVQSVSGTWAWVTCPGLLSRLSRDLKVSGSTVTLPAIPQVANGEALITDTSILPVGTTGVVVLDDWQLTYRTGGAGANDWAVHLSSLLSQDDVSAMLAGRLCIVSDTMFSLAAELATEVQGRIRLNEQSKTVDRGALWYEEALPAETVLFGLVRAEKSRIKDGTSMSPREVLQGIGAERFAQFGGKAGTGRGLCQWRMPGGNA